MDPIDPLSDPYIQSLIPKPTAKELYKAAQRDARRIKLEKLRRLPVTFVKRVAELISCLTPVRATRHLARQRGAIKFAGKPTVNVDPETKAKTVHLYGLDRSGDPVMMSVRFYKGRRQPFPTQADM